MRKSNPIRTCVVCRAKLPQQQLSRYRLKGDDIECGKGFGRSFYICDECLKKDEKILKKILNKYTKGVSSLLSNLKEILLNGKY
ncbi:DUF448 domain-containing protein [Campylobacter mucosalis]|uniref:Putative nucleic-acid-binding protein (DUF448 domain) n=1 Tax=Campylobacter mucosalis CCUG 21559 TaxID=1032067 RepID=A0A6G5QF19_9BACT|nr:DUF448 domain-containing protein [Campylobacter mucosalis]QCD44303.1 putative nucleic-acid-binding protein (DUF448 domain) [Campylobacter mucosalis CCUG 21559]